MIFDRRANLEYKYSNRHFWCVGCYADTADKNAKKIQDYIKNQIQWINSIFNRDIFGILVKDDIIIFEILYKKYGEN